MSSTPSVTSTTLSYPPSPTFDDPLYFTYVAYLTAESQQMYGTSQSPGAWLAKMLALRSQEQMKLILERRSLQELLRLPTYPGRISVPVQWDRLLYGTLQITFGGNSSSTIAYSLEFLGHLAQFCGWLLRTLEDAAFSQYQRPQVTPHMFQLVATLSPREREVLTLMVRNYTAAEIAGALTLSKRTVEGHQHHIYEALHVTSRYAAIQIGLIAGLL